MGREPVLLLPMGSEAGRTLNMCKLDWPLAHACVGLSCDQGLSAPRRALSRVAQEFGKADITDKVVFETTETLAMAPGASSR